MAETDILSRLEKDETLLLFGGMKRMANDVREARELIERLKDELAMVKADADPLG